MPRGKVGTWKNSRVFLLEGASWKGWDSKILGLGLGKVPGSFPRKSWNLEKFPGFSNRVSFLEGLGHRKIPGCLLGGLSWKSWNLKIPGPSS